MKKSIFPTLALLLGIGLSAQSAGAADCAGPWNVLPNRNNNMAPCTQLGLDTHRGVCQPGQAYETLCDDMKGGRYRICQGPRPCGNTFVPPPQPPPAQVAPPCSSWDYSRNQPCPPGYINHDCRGDCGPAR